jgi:hypothetical protein
MFERAKLVAAPARSPRGAPGFSLIEGPHAKPDGGVVVAVL